MRVIASERHREHEPLELSRGAIVSSNESPRRAELIAHALRAIGFTFSEPDPVDDALLGKVHTAEYLDFLSTAWDRWVARGNADSPAMGFTWPARGFAHSRPDDLVGQLGYHSFAADCSVVAGTWQAAVGAAAIAQTAADRVLVDAAPAYALCRPPGHHATADQFGGYCYLNNSAVAAQRLIDRGVQRVAVLDVDYHHGNGTQSVFYRRADVFTVSLHADPIFEFPWFAGHADETGEGEGEDGNLNLPLPRGTTAAAWNDALSVALDRIVAFNAGAIVVALGVDSYVDDPLGTFTLMTDDYGHIAQRIAALDRPTVIVQEGGYATDAIGDNVAAFLAPFDRG